MRLLCVSLALAIIYIIAIVHDSGVEARAATNNEPRTSFSEVESEGKPNKESSSSSSSSESMEVPAKPANPEQTVEAFALGIPTILGGLYWTELAFDTMYNNSMHIADKMDEWPQFAQAVKEYIIKSLTW